METSRNNYTRHILARIGPGNQGIVAVVGNFKSWVHTYVLDFLGGLMVCFFHFSAHPSLLLIY